MTDSLFISWLKDSSAIRCVLVEINVKSGGVETTRYLSTKGYVTTASDTPANTGYTPVVSGGIKFTETLSLTGAVSLSFGDIEIDNFSGALDGWIDDIWVSRSVKVYMGDVTWARTDFRLIFAGITTDIDSKNRGKLNIKVGDNLQRLNTVVSEVKLGGSTPRFDTLIPLCFGECHNITPLLVDQNVNEYQVHDGAIESIIEVRDNGVPVLFTAFLATGKFRLTNQPVGVITCSVQGDKPSTYSNDIASLVKRLVMDYGLLAKRFLISEIDVAGFAAFAIANPQPVGLFLSARTNVLQEANVLAYSVGGRVVVTRTGLLSLVKIALPQLTAGTAVGPSDMVDKSLAMSQHPLVVAAVKLGYDRNYTVQPTLLTAIPTAHKDMYAQEWLTLTLTDSVAALDYIAYTEPVVEPTQLLTASDGLTEATRRLALSATQRKAFKYIGLSHLMLEELGASQTITSNRFGLSGSVRGQIISIATDWLNPHITIEVLV